MGHFPIEKLRAVQNAYLVQILNDPFPTFSHFGRHKLPIERKGPKEEPAFGLGKRLVLSQESNAPSDRVGVCFKLPITVQ